MQRCQLLALVCSFLLMQSSSLALAEELAKPVPTTAVPIQQTKPVAQPVSQDAASPSGAVLNSKLAQREPLTLEASQGKVFLAKTAYFPHLDLFFQTNWASVNQLTGLFIPMPGLMPVAGGNTTPNWHGYWGNCDGLEASWTAFGFGYREAELNAAKADTAVVRANRKKDKTLDRVTVCLDPEDYAKFETRAEDEGLL